MQFGVSLYLERPMSVPLQWEFSGTSLFCGWPPYDTASMPVTSFPITRVWIS